MARRVGLKEALHELAAVAGALTLPSDSRTADGVE
jgi:hypothetical protein